VNADASAGSGVRAVVEVLAKALADAPDEEAELSLAKQVGDESRHVSIQRRWMLQFDADPTPIIIPEQEQLIREHPRTAEGFAAQRRLNLIEMDELTAKHGA